MNDLTLIRRNLFRRKLRAGLMMVSILIAFLIFGVLASFERAFNAGEDVAQADRLIVVNKINFTQPLPMAYFERVKAVPGVRQVTYANWFGGYYQEPRNFIITFAVDPESYLEVYGDQWQIAPEARATFRRDRTTALVGENAARRWGWKVGDRVPLSSTIFSQKNGSHTWEITIAGIAKPNNPQADTNILLIHYDYFNDSRTFGKDTIGWIVINTDQPALNDQVAKAVDRLFTNATAETSTEAEKAFNKAFAAQFGNIALMVELVVSAAFFTILLIVGNTMTMAVRERTRELAVLKTLGFGPWRILRLVLGETLLLAFLGGIPGLGLAWLVTLWLGDSVAAFVPNMVMLPEILLGGLGMMFNLGLITGLIPALAAMRLNIAAALGRS